MPERGQRGGHSAEIWGCIDGQSSVVVPVAGVNMHVGMLATCLHPESRQIGSTLLLSGDQFEGSRGGAVAYDACPDSQDTKPTWPDTNLRPAGSNGLTLTPSSLIH